MTPELEASAKNVKAALERRGQKLVLVESCTSGAIAATLGVVPGISAYFCGSYVVYRPESKIRWFGIDPSFVEAVTCESREMADRLALCALTHATEADWSLAIVGHFGPNAPEGKDGKIWISIHEGVETLHVYEHELPKLWKTSRYDRQQLSVELALDHLLSCLERIRPCEEGIPK